MDVVTVSLVAHSVVPDVLDAEFSAVLGKWPCVVLALPGVMDAGTGVAFHAFSVGVQGAQLCKGLVEHGLKALWEDGSDPFLVVVELVLCGAVVWHGRDRNNAGENIEFD